MNPFPIHNYQGAAYFCDREKETRQLTDNILNGSNTAFFARRRIGKTALIHHVFHQLKKKDITCIYLDIYATRNLQDLTNQLANAIYGVFPDNKSIGKRFWQAIKLLRPTVSFDAITGEPELSLDITQPRQIEKTIPQLLQFLDGQNIKVVIAIDEFQQILNYPEKNVEALLRTAIQQLSRVSFVFAGSNRQMMLQIFQSAKRPFYSSTKNLQLLPIDENLYADFIRARFEHEKRKISQDAVSLILELTCRHTYYTQRLCHDIFQTGQRSVNEETVRQVFADIIKQEEPVFYQFRNLITPGQWQLLKAIALEEKLEKPYNHQFISDHRLKTPSIVKRSLEALLEKELVYAETHPGGTTYEVYDKFLMRWLARHK